MHKPMIGTTPDDQARLAGSDSRFCEDLVNGLGFLGLWLLIALAIGSLLYPFAWPLIRTFLH